MNEPTNDVTDEDRERAGTDASRDGIASMAILALTVVAIVFVVSRIV